MDLVRKWRASHKEGWHDQECCVNELLDDLEAQLKAWESQILAGIEERKTQFSLGPLHDMATNQAANDILQHILGVKF